jgi:quercetin dioxygenase-like cupin family protein
MTTPLRIDAKTVEPQTWDSPSKGTLFWRSLFDGAVTPTSDMICGVAEMQPGQHFALHHHPQAEIYFGIEGEADVMIDSIPHRLQPGVALFIPGGAVHGVPETAMPMRWFYVFAADRFDQIDYSFLPPAKG